MKQFADEMSGCVAGLSRVQHDMGMGTGTERIQGDADGLQGSHT